MTTIGILSHGKLAEGLLDALELITGAHENVFALGLAPGDSPEAFKQRLDDAMSKFEDGEFLFLVDLQGGTPYNVAAVMTSEKHHCIAGVNLPMVMQVAMDSQSKSLAELAETAASIGRESVVDVSAELKKLRK